MGLPYINAGRSYVQATVPAETNRVGVKGVMVSGEKGKGSHALPRV